MATTNDVMHEGRCRECFTPEGQPHLKDCETGRGMVGRCKTCGVENGSPHLPDCTVGIVEGAASEWRREAVDHPAHYGGAGNPYETIVVIEKWGLGFHLGNAAKYIARAGKKGDLIEDCEKARWYLDRYIALLKAGKSE